MQPLIIIRGVSRIAAAAAFVGLFFYATYAVNLHSPSLTKYLLCITPAAIVALSGFDDLAQIFVFRSKLIFYFGALAALAGLLYFGGHTTGLRMTKLAAPILAILIAAVVVRLSPRATGIINMIAGLVSASLLFFGLTYEGHFASHAISTAIFTLGAAGLLSAILTAALRDQPNPVIEVR